MVGRHTTPKQNSKKDRKILRPELVQSSDENLFGITVEDLKVDSLNESDIRKGQP